MIERFEWSDYELAGPPTFFLGDYTIMAFGRVRAISHLMTRMRRIWKRDESVRWILMDFWGTGKSTLMYNLCHELNKRWFFPSGSHKTLALYVNYPRRAQDLLDYTYDNGLPLPWTPTEQKDKLSSARRELFWNAARMIAYAWLTKALNDRDFKLNGTPHAIGNTEYYREIKSLNGEKIAEYVDHLPQKNSIYSSLAGFLSSFLEYSKKCGKLGRDWIISDRTVRNLPGLLFPETSSTYLESFYRLFSEPRKGLRNFSEFHKVCELINIHVLVIIDEAEDWNNMAKTRLDDFLIEILPTGRLSVVLILRTEVMNRLRGVQKRLRYLLVKSWMKCYRSLPDPSPTEILEIAKGILSTWRVDKCPNLFPFTDEFILALSNLTVRGGHFNLRMFVRSLERILRLSLNWERSDAQIDVGFIKDSQLLDAVSENLIIEEGKELKSSSVFVKAEEIQKKMQAAREISGYLLEGMINPPTRYMLNIAKEIMSEKYRIPILDDIEIIAYSKQRERVKVNRLIRALKEAPMPNERVVQSLKWHFISTAKPEQTLQ